MLEFSFALHKIVLNFFSEWTRMFELGFLSFLFHNRLNNIFFCYINFLKSLYIKTLKSLYRDFSSWYCQLHYDMLHYVTRWRHFRRRGTETPLGKAFDYDHNRACRHNDFIFYCQKLWGLCYIDDGLICLCNRCCKYHKTPKMTRKLRI